MAFQFIPPFNEGDKQTNPDTQVEYIFTGGAWRPLGPSIEDEFDTLDDRYIKRQDTTVLGDYYRLRGPNAAGDGTSTFQVIDEGLQKLYNVATPDKTNEAWVANVEFVNDTVSDYLPLTGGTIQGQMYFDVNADGQHNIGIAPRDADSTSVIYSMNGGICRLRSLAGNNINSTDVRTHFGWGRNADGDPETVLYHLKDPTDSLHAVNLQYLESYVTDKVGDVDLSAYLPLTGGEMTGKLTINDTVNNAKIDFKGTTNVDIQRDSTWIVSLKPNRVNVRYEVDVNNNQIKRVADPTDGSDAATKDYVDNNSSPNSMNVNGENVVTTNWIVRGSGRTFMQNSNNELGLYRLKAPSESHHAARKQDVDNHKAKARTGTSTSPTLTTGELYYNTNTKQLFIGE